MMREMLASIVQRFQPSVVQVLTRQRTSCATVVPSFGAAQCQRSRFWANEQGSFQPSSRFLLIDNNNYSSRLFVYASVYEVRMASPKFA